LPSVTPAETPAPPLTLALLLNQALYAPGDEFLFQAAVIKRVLESVAADQYIVLDVWGEYFFWPSWLQSVDFAPRTFIAPYDVEELLRFVWPDGAGDALGIMLWGALTRPDSIDLLSLDTAVFSFTGSSDPTPAPTETPDPTAAPSPTPTPTVGISPTPLPPRHVTLPGNVAWLDSGLDVREGEPLTVLGFGQICFHIGDCPGTTVGPCGYRDICYDPECQEQPYDPGFHHGGIIARIGDNPPFLICDEYSQSAPASGSLFLGINDGNVTDNGMEFQVYIVSEQ